MLFIETLVKFFYTKIWLCLFLLNEKVRKTLKIPTIKRILMIAMEAAKSICQKLIMPEKNKIILLGKHHSGMVTFCDCLMKQNHFQEWVGYKLMGECPVKYNGRNFIFSYCFIFSLIKKKEFNLILNSISLVWGWDNNWKPTIIMRESP